MKTFIGPSSKLLRSRNVETTQKFREGKYPNYFDDWAENEPSYPTFRELHATADQLVVGRLKISPKTRRLIHFRCDLAQQLVSNYTQ